MPTINLNFTNEMLEKHFKNFFFHSLKYDKEKYINLIFTHHQIIPDHVAYLCPLCTKNWIFITKSYSKCSSEFSEDHYPPSNSGGTKTIITCKPCNNVAGHKYDFALEQYLDVLSYNKRILNSTMPLRHKLDGLPNFMNGKLIVNESEVFSMQLKRNENDKILPLDNWMETNKNNEELKFEIQPKNPDLKKVHQAILHAAYLYCFENFGYEFIFSKAGELFRKVFNDEMIYPAPISQCLDDLQSLKTMPIGLCYIKEPESLQSLIVNLELINKTTGYKAIQTVLIPNPNDDGIEKVEIQSAIFKNFSGNLKVMPLDNKLFAGIPNAYTKTWKDMCELS